jgi:hypothetical protein
MKQDKFKPMSTEALWAFHQQICSALSTKLADRKLEIERRFHVLKRAAGQPRGQPATRR